MKRVLLFLITNFAILIVASVTLRLLGFEPWLNQQGINFNSLLVFGALLGFGGAFVSLALSKWTAKKMMGVQLIERPRNEVETWLVETVRRQAQLAGIGMPEVGYFESPQPNAFATGASRNNALVAVSSGLVNRMSRTEVEAVLGHEISHVANGDMVTLTLIQGVVNTFVFVASRLVGNLVDRVVFRNEQGHGPAFWITTIVTELVLAFLASMVVMWFSRQREFRADSGGARLAGRNNMIGALEALKRGQPEPLPDSMAAFGIAGGVGQGLRKLFMSHPPLDERIAALRNAPLS
ncbi:MAG: protease HtpX [Gammaproteobacteria bacterium]|nr:MAG: protease HtpX [Gammaproteobacteria bacterium]